MIEEVAAELERAQALFPSIRSLHEAIAVIREEYLEVEREIFTSRRNPEQIESELIQLAAMCLRTIQDCLR